MKYIKIFKILFSLFVFITSSYAYDFSLITTDDDIYELFYQGEINEYQKDNLLYMLENPIDLNSSIEKEYYNLKSIYKDTLDDDIGPYILNDFFMKKGSYCIGVLGGNSSLTNYSNQKGIYKYFFSYHNQDNNLLNKVILGNFKVNFGSGITLSNSRQIEGISPDSGISHKFYGIAFTLNPIKQIYLFCLYSTPNENVTEEIQETLKGINLKYENYDKNFDIGLTWYESKFKFLNDSTNIKFYKENDDLSAIGINLNLKSDPHLFYSEITHMSTGAEGGIIRITSYYPNTYTNFIYRYYEKNFINPYSLSFSSEDDEPNNSDEKGIYSDITHFVFNDLQIGGYYNLWQHPSSGISADQKNINLKYLFSENITGEFYRAWKNTNIDPPSTLYNIIELNYKLSKKLKFILKGQETKKNDELDRSSSLNLSYKFNQMSQFDYRIKTKMEDINNLDSQKWEYYIQHRLSLRENLKFLLRYTRLDYIKEDQIKAELKLYW